MQRVPVLGDSKLQAGSAIFLGNQRSHMAHLLQSVERDAVPLVEAFETDERERGKSQLRAPDPCLVRATSLEVFSKDRIDVAHGQDVRKEVLGRLGGDERRRQGLARGKRDRTGREATVNSL